MSRNMDEFQKLRIAENDLRGKIFEIQQKTGASNDAMCLALRDIIGDYEKARSTDYLLTMYVKEQNKMISSAEDEQAKEAEKTEETKEG